MDTQNRHVNQQAAYTKPGTTYPGYINVTREGDEVTVTIRGDARDGQPGPLASLALSWAEWRRFEGEVKGRL